MTTVKLINLTKFYPKSPSSTIKNLSLEIETGKLTALLGPSGCGKTTILKMIAGLLPASAGDILFNDSSVLNTSAEKREAVMVFQNSLLFPYLSIKDNIGFGLRMRKIPKVEIYKKVNDMLDLVQLPNLQDRKPNEISGGQQQRVALARALIIKPKVLLLDEPLSNLDTHLRIEMRSLIYSIQKELNITTVLVTHDQEEAIVLADKIALILNGKLKQFDTSENLYSRPADAAVVKFFGGNNLIPGKANDGNFACSIGTFTIPKEIDSGTGLLTFRPESLLISKSINNNKPKANSFQGVLKYKINLGSQTKLTFQINSEIIEAIAKPNETHDMQIGQSLTLTIPNSSLWVVRQ